MVSRQVSGPGNHAGTETVCSTMLRQRGLQLDEVQRRRVAERPEQQEDPEQEAEVADAVDDEGLHPAVGIPAVAVPEADQQIRAEPHAFPAEEEHQQVVAEDEQQHRAQEQVQVREEALEAAVVAVVVVHVADRVDVDQRADARDDQAHDRRERIERETHLGGNATRADPGEDLVDQHAALARAAQYLGQGHAGDGERGDRRAARDRDDQPARHLAAQQAEPDAVHQRAEQR